MTRSPHADDTIRAIARDITGQAVSDYQITFTAQQAGCVCPVTPDLRSLNLLDRFRLVKFMMSQGKRFGLSVERMAQATRTEAGRAR